MLTATDLTPKRALRYIAEEPATLDATPEQLRNQAKIWEEDALSHERLARRSKRRSTKDLWLLRVAAQIRGNAKLVCLAATEVERVGARTVGEAKRSWFERLCRNLKSATQRHDAQSSAEEMSDG